MQPQTTIIRGEWDSTAQWIAYLLLDHAALGSIPSVPNNFSEEKSVYVAEISQQGKWTVA